MISLILITIAAIAKAFMDLSADDKLPLRFNKEYTWGNKYKNGFPNQGPAFFGSTTFLVFLTDFWHLMQMLFLTCMFSAVVLYKPLVTPLVDFVIMRVVFGCVFELLYSKGWVNEGN